ncbi:MAG: multiprotein-bridging factor 1 family protein [Variibacter sp.]
MLYAAQIRAARALLAWRQEDLAKASKVGLATIQRIEQAGGIAMANVSTLLRLQEALEKAGIRFLDADQAGGVGVRWDGKAQPR